MMLSMEFLTKDALSEGVITHKNADEYKNYQTANPQQPTKATFRQSASV
jgi:hypothetical protein